MWYGIFQSDLKVFSKVLSSHKTDLKGHFHCLFSNSHINPFPENRKLWKFQFKIRKDIRKQNLPSDIARITPHILLDLYFQQKCIIIKKNSQIIILIITCRQWRCERWPYQCRELFWQQRSPSPCLRAASAGPPGTHHRLVQMTVSR